MKTALTIAAITVGLALPAEAQDYRPVTDQSEFLALIADRSLTNRLYNLSLDVAPSGQIAGSAMGWDVTGTWSWQGGFFCREMAWGGDPIPYNCQLVEVAGNEMRFTTDQGAGDSASFRLR
ncbi:dihydrodipicolinate reductase [Yoonia sp. R2331]|uniref:dihydrodipicolinate reductase n=1 Tax=Yoonia sp. R2331 TaxID=3237238 RepID=UPI0034E3E019